jgi:hypothetical protein
MRNFSRSFAAAWLLLMSATGLAATHTWTVSGTFSDGGTVAGTLVYDATTGTVVTWNLGVAGGNTASFAQRIYTPANTTESTLALGGGQPTLLFGATDEGTRELRITPSAALDGSVSLVTMDVAFSLECFNCAPLRTISAGHFSLQAPAIAPLTWTVTGGTFSDGGTVSGTFRYDAVTGTVPTWSLSVAGGNTAFFAPRTFTPANAIEETVALAGASQPTLLFTAIDEANRQLRITPSALLDGSTNPDSMDFAFSVECFSCSPFRTITAGTLVLKVKPPPPATAIPTLAPLALAALTLMLALLARRLLS